MEDTTGWKSKTGKIAEWMSKDLQSQEKLMWKRSQQRSCFSPQKRSVCLDFVTENWMSCISKDNEKTEHNTQESDEWDIPKEADKDHEREHRQDSLLLT